MKFNIGGDIWIKCQGNLAAAKEKLVLRKLTSKSTKRQYLLLSLQFVHELGKSQILKLPDWERYSGKRSKHIEKIKKTFWWPAHIREK